MRRRRAGITRDLEREKSDLVTPLALKADSLPHHRLFGLAATPDLTGSHHPLSQKQKFMWGSQTRASSISTKIKPGGRERKKKRVKGIGEDLRLAKIDPDPIRKSGYPEGPNPDPDSKMLDPSKPDPDPDILIFKSGYPDPAQAMEKLRQKPRIDMETLNYQSTKERKIVEQEGMEFCSVGSSSFSECCPSDLSIEGYITAKVFKVFELERKAALLPPPPKSPAESWSWRKPNRIAPILLFEKC
ncbi:hypothetical protein F2Q68_00038883 [Brassica cretica]|uniref:Uncharacterized protein n=2 Tax=Brassica cretica TaxID=69181 RepID=A0A8S9MGQ4_BRACR|nr:hypothetical protein F2Q68_00038883 [Brassica cretica]KAF3492713.1 hypothetical protein DY000_02052447 [Brassica cretica]